MKKQPNAWQAALRDRILELLASYHVVGVKVSSKLARFDEDDDEPAGAAASASTGPELSLVIKLEIEGDPIEVWIYPDAAGVLEPGDDWWPFDRPDFASSKALADALVAHLRDIFAGDEPEGG